MRCKQMAGALFVVGARPRAVVGASAPPLLCDQPAHGRDRPCHIRIGWFRRQRKADGLSPNPHGVGPLFGRPAEASLVMRMLRYKEVVHAGADAACVHRVEELGAGDMMAFPIHHAIEPRGGERQAYVVLAVQGSVRSMPQPVKSRVLRVASDAPRERAMAAIMASNWLMGRPLVLRLAAMSA